MKKLTQILLAVLIFGLFLSCQTAKPTETVLPESTATKSSSTVTLNLAPEVDKPLHILFDGDLCVFVGEKGLLFNYETPNIIDAYNIDAYKVGIENGGRYGLYRAEKSHFDDYMLSIATVVGWQPIKHYATLEELYRWIINGTE